MKERLTEKNGYEVADTLNAIHEGFFVYCGYDLAPIGNEIHKFTLTTMKGFKPFDVKNKLEYLRKKAAAAK